MKRFFEIATSPLPQTTINKPLSVVGRAVRFSSKKSTIQFLQSENQGLFFRVNGEEIPVSPLNVFIDEKNHCTNLKSGSVEVKEAEHILSAAYGLGITNLIIEIKDGNEPPIMDGSAKSFANALLKSGIKRLFKKRQEIRITSRFKFSLPENDRFIKVEPSKNFFLDLKVDFPPPIGKQRLSSVITPEIYQKEIAFARSPLRCSIEETSQNQLRKWFKGYGKTKDWVIYYSREKYLTKLRVEDEVVKHKALDFIGDIANIGLPIKGKFTCYKIGHKVNGEFVKLFS